MHNTDIDPRRRVATARRTSRNVVCSGDTGVFRVRARPGLAVGVPGTQDPFVVPVFHCTALLLCCCRRLNAPYINHRRPVLCGAERDGDARLHALSLFSRRRRRRRASKEDEHAALTRSKCGGGFPVKPYRPCYACRI